MGKLWGLIGIALFWPFVFSIGALAQDTGSPPLTPELLKQGEALYKKQCAVCHGSEGKGDGSAADFLFPKPRDFTKGIFKVRSTSTLPTDEDLLRIITHGMPGTSMPPWAALSEKDHRALLAYVKRFSDKFRAEPLEALTLPKPPSLSPQLLSRGKQLYQEAGCFECHGASGKGDGPAAATLKDDWGYPIVPYDFTIAGKMKGGSALEDIYRTLMVGIGGTPMPSYADSLSEEEGWALAHYVKSLAGPKPAMQPTPGPVVARKVPSPLPRDPFASLWQKTPGTTIPLMPLWQRKEATEVIQVKALHDGREIAFLLEWEDWQVNASVLRPQDFSDAAAIMFSLSPQRPLPELPHFAMGEKGKPVNIWYWRLDRQLDLAGFQDIEKVYPAMVSDDYQLERARYPKDSEKPGHLPTTAAPAHDPAFITGWGAGNLLSIPMRPSAVEDLNAEGFGTLTAQALADQNVKGQGLYVAGRWKVVLTRELRSKRPFDVRLKEGGTFPLAFAVWDGAKGDRDGQKAVSIWQRLEIRN